MRGKFPEFQEITLVHERKFILQTAALQRRITAAPKPGWKGQVFPACPARGGKMVTSKSMEAKG